MVFKKNEKRLRGEKRVRGGFLEMSFQDILRSIKYTQEFCDWVSDFSELCFLVCKMEQ